MIPEILTRFSISRQHIKSPAMKKKSLPTEMDPQDSKLTLPNNFLMDSINPLIIKIIDPFLIVDASKNSTGG